MKKGVFFSVVVLLISANLFADNTQGNYPAGIAFYQQGQYDKAVQSLQAATQADPQNWQAFQVLGQAEYQLNRFDDALSALNQSLQINPNNPKLAQFRDYVKTKVGNGPPLPTADQNSPAVGAGVVRGPQALSQFYQGWDLQEKSRLALKQYGATHPLTEEESNIVKFGEPPTNFSFPKFSLTMGFFTPTLYSLDLGIFLDPTTNVGLNFGYIPITSSYSSRGAGLIYLDPRIKFYSTPSGLSTFNGFGLIYYSVSTGTSSETLSIIAPNYIFGFRTLSKDSVFTFEMDCEAGVAVASITTLGYTYYDYYTAGYITVPDTTSTIPIPFIFPEMRLGLVF